MLVRWYPVRYVVCPRDALWYAVQLAQEQTANEASTSKAAPAQQVCLPPL